MLGKHIVDNMKSCGPTWRQAQNYAWRAHSFRYAVRICFIAGGLINTTGCSLSSPHTTYAYPIDLSFIRHGVQLEYTVTSYPDEMGRKPDEHSLQSSTWFGVRPVRTLSDLKGLVTISNATDAVSFVRLRSGCGAHYYDWPGDWITEVVKQESNTDASSFDQNSPINPGQYADTGVLDNDEFLQLGYTTATVSLIGNKFVITRWLLIGNPTNCYPKYVEKVREYVGRDGDYSLEVLKKENVASDLLVGPHAYEWMFSSPPTGWEIS